MHQIVSKMMFLFLAPPTGNGTFLRRSPHENDNSFDLISVFETRTRILKVTILPEFSLQWPHYFESQKV